MLVLMNFVAVPLFAVILLNYASFELSAKIGLLLFACSAGAPFIIQLVQITEGDLALCVSVLIVLMPASVLYLPFVVPLLVPEANVSALAIGIPLVWSLLVPLVIGLVVRGVWPRLAAKIQLWMKWLASVSLVVLIVALTVANLPAIAGILGQGVLFAAFLITVVGFGLGYIIGGTRKEVRRVTAFGTAQRNIAAAMVVASQGLGDNLALLVIVASSLVALAVLFGLAFAIRRRDEKHQAGDKKQTSGKAPRPMIYEEV